MARTPSRKLGQRLNPANQVSEICLNFANRATSNRVVEASTGVAGAERFFLGQLGQGFLY